jgi:hypothetical protein
MEKYIKLVQFNILYPSGDFIEFDEKIYFREKQDLIKDSEQNAKLEKIIKSQSDKIVQLENTITIMTSLIGGLENKLRQLGNRLSQLESEQFYVLNRGELNCIPKVVDELILKSVVACTNNYPNGHEDFGAYFNYTYFSRKCEYKYDLRCLVNNSTDIFNKSWIMGSIKQEYERDHNNNFHRMFRGYHYSGDIEIKKKEFEEYKTTYKTKNF